MIGTQATSIYLIQLKGKTALYAQCDYPGTGPWAGRGTSLTD